ncbi:flagellar hook-associated protein FlgL [Ketobacter alkanivorans]|uniref:Flagellar hook-associated protein 3 n=1 Tax=Ketobacter alkanivorans TaxID=1917421 RepID=A0A2K9LLH0_9GAMM|nr:flagellar hook-associated protein FlgL [Ketobacter alkanivorans]AUM11644.1 flagellar hook-associated protein 3 [Ketobacter alkanivorans]MCP5015276.1 flagellar hook-associated protein 3 [Ketobacter sp.]
MPIRISTSQTFSQGTNSILNNQSKVSQTQLQLSKGTRILKPSDDPIGSAVALDLQKQIDNALQYISNGQTAETKLAIEESSLSNVTDILQRIRELTLQAANATQNQADRAAITVEIKQRLDELVGLGNSQLANGEYLFSGFKSNVRPFTADGTGNISYNGDQGVLNVNVNTSVRVESGNSGDEVFFDIKTGNGSFVAAGDPSNLGTGVISSAVLEDPTLYVGDVYTIDFSLNGSGALQYQITGANTGPVYAAPLPLYDEDTRVSFNGINYSISGLPSSGDSFTVEPSFRQSVFATVNQIITALEIPNSTSTLQATFQNALNVGLQNLDQAMTHIDEVRASVGSRLNVIESESEINESLKVEAQSALSVVKDLDYAEAITELNKRTLALQAAQQSFVKVQNLSLFEFI